MKHLLTVFLFLAFSFNAYSQISLQNISGFPSLASNNHLLNTLQGTGIQLTNINYTGDNYSIGYFYSGDSIIGISNGLVLTTGHTSTIGWNVNNNASGTSSNTAGSSDPDISSIANAITFDASILEMDFVSSGDSIEFQMVFASEEYPEFVCAFNDAFAFLVSGDGYNGIYSNGAENIALIPNTNDPISINTVNGGIAAGTATPCVTTNTNYYIDNPPALTGGNSPYPFYFDGFTKVITVKFRVTPDSIYHLKMVIADALDPSMDSGVFLKAHSLSSNGPAMVNTQLVVNTSLGNGWTNEQCGSFELGVAYPTPLTQADTLEIITSGSAINNVDYINMPSFLIGNIGDTAIPPVTIDIVSDVILEATDEIHIYLKRQGVIIDSAFVYITDSSIYNINVPDATICAGDSANLNATIQYINNSNIHSFSNNTQMPILDNNPLAPTISKITVPGVPANLSFESVCVDITHVWAADIDIYLVSPSSQIIELSSDNGLPGSGYPNVCFTSSATNSILNYNGVSGSYLPEQSLNLLEGTPMNGEWSLVVFDDVSFFTGTLNAWTLTFTSEDDLQYNWSPATGLDCASCSVVNASPDSTTSYIVTTTNLVGCAITDTVQVNVLPKTQFSLLPCSNIGDSTITFNWQTDGTETNSQVSFDNGLTWTTLSAGVYNYTLNNLQPGNPYSILLKSVNSTNCDVIPLSDTCATTGCVPVNFSVNAVNGTDSTLGSIQLNINNSTGIVSYLWNTGDTTSMVNNLAAGVYSATITDANGCPITTSVTICNVITPIITIINATDSTLGSIDLSVNSSIGTVTYLWNTGDTASMITNLQGGTYTVTMTDVNNCVTITDIVVCGVITPIITIVNATDTTAGSIDLSVNNPTNYLWSTGDTTSSISNLLGGIYSVTMTDANNCPSSFDIIVCGIISPVITTIPDSGFANVGTIDVTISGGFPPFSYQWNNGSTGSNLSGLLTGTYLGVVTDDLNCTHLITATVSDLVNNHDLKTVETLIISPNPTADLVNIQMTLSTASPLRIYVRDITGKLLKSQLLDNNQAHQTTFDLSNFPNGTYLIQFELDEDFFSKRVILQR